jgi:hypothetical protein
MDLKELIYEVGSNVFIKDARVETIEKIVNGANLRIQVRILEPSTVPVTRIDTWLVKLDKKGEIVCVLQPNQFFIFAVTEFTLSGAILMPAVETTNAYELVDAILSRIQPTDDLKVLHIMPAKNPGKYCSFKETTNAPV